MAKRLETKREFERDIIKKMTKLGTYKPEYSNLIAIFAGMLHQYSEFEKLFEESDYQITEEYTNKAGATNERKVPLYMAIESLRKDIATYTDKLCLSPKSLETVTTDNTKGSKLSKLLNELS